MRLSTLAFAAASAATALSFGALTPMFTFGNGDGWRAPNEVVVGDLAATNFGGTYGFLGTGAVERGMAYNPVTGNLLLVSRQNRDLGSGLVNTNVRILNGTTGADVGGLSGGTINTSGTFPVSTVGVADDGAIYVANLSTASSTTSNFKVFRWASEAAGTFSVAFDGLTGVTRTGDAMAVFGSGANTKIAAAGTTTALNGNFVILNTVDGSTYTNTTYNTIAGTTAASNDYRLGLTFVDSDTLIGNQGGNARITDFAATATVTGTVPLGAAQRPLDYAVIDGLPLLAVVDANSSTVQIFDITNPAAPLLFDQGNATTGLLTGNGNGVGNVQWGAINGQEATLYVMSTNQGIQAFNFRIPEPTCLSLLGVAAIATMRRRRA